MSAHSSKVGDPRLTTFSAGPAIRDCVFLFGLFRLFIVYCFVVFQDRFHCLALAALELELQTLAGLKPRDPTEVCSTTPSKAFYFVKRLGSSETEPWSSETITAQYKDKIRTGNPEPAQACCPAFDLALIFAKVSLPFRARH